ncbi:MarR family transcriptional regulator [Altererythrobacter sp. H2]|jgi:MarR family transcriptional regulator for hemolysin|uniref:MarR family winged helix-turn-helix transcriptional regulator n=1 Tax=Altererythrobacter sp. H2 TaxID=3108391 RepID=UPI002B4BF94B|nr:MarR family transcriptional regulator [Altererythrobacter sp. H2]WRK94611.1 MarR family transcriptional regulator [Altererythrobacter sp. H2]
MPDEISQDSYVTEADEIVFLVEEVPRKLRRLFDASTAKFGLTRTQWRALAYIFRSPGLTQTELARHLDLERASVGHVIDQLEKAHFVERRSIEGNRRVWSLHLLPKAIEILPSLRLEADAIYTQLLAGISATEYNTVKTLLGKMSGNIAD